jgi:hypothetical protein
MHFLVTLHNAQAGYTALLALWDQLKPYLIAGHKIQIEAFDGKTREQERLCHSCYRDLARDCLLAGAKADAELWKESLKYVFYLVTKDDPEFAEDWRTRKPRMVPLIDGDGFVMTPIESKRFTKRLYAAFITFIHATGDARGVKWSKTSLGREWAGLTLDAGAENVAEAR